LEEHDHFAGFCGFSFWNCPWVDSTDERNMMNIMTSPEDSQWRKWAGLVCRRSRSTNYGQGGKQASR
jgi:hypothetical protein